MATVEQLVTAGLLRPVMVDLGGSLPVRQIFGTLDFIAWLSTALPQLENDYDGHATPTEQVENLLAEYISGHPLNYGDGGNLRCLRPVDRGVVELKTADVRIFGWFVRKDRYIATFGHSATRVKTVDLYAGFRNETCRIRDTIDLDAPKFILGTAAHDFLSL